MEKLSQVLNSNIEKLWSDLHAVDAKFRGLVEAVSEVRAQVMTAKSNNPEIQGKELEVQLEEFRKLSFEMSLTEDFMRSLMHNLVALYNIATVNSVKLDFPEQTLEDMKTTTDNAKQLYTVDSKGEVVVIDAEMYEMLLKELKKNVPTEERLNEILHSPVFEANQSKE